MQSSKEKIQRKQRFDDGGYSDGKYDDVSHKQKDKQKDEYNKQRRSKRGEG